MKRYLLIPLTALAVVTAAQAPADDTEVFHAMDGGVPPNILFVVDRSSSMKNAIGGKTKKQIMAEAMSKLLAKDTNGKYKRINVGLMDFAKRGGGVDFPIASLDASASDYETPLVDFPDGWKVADVLDNITQKEYALNSPGLNGDLGTNIPEALAEAWFYYAGRNVRYGNFSPMKWSQTGGWKDGWQWRAAFPPSYKGGETIKSGTTTRTTICYTDVQGNDANNVNLRACKSEEKSKPGFSCTRIAKGEKTRTDTTCTHWVEASGERARYCTAYASTTYSNEFPMQECRYNEEIPKTTTTPRVYISPVKTSCQSNYIVLFSDGRPEIYNNEQKPTAPYGLYDTFLKGLFGGSKIGESCGAVFGLNSESDWKKKSSGACGPELAEWMADPDKAKQLGIPLGKTVTTYTIGFDIANDPFAADYLKLIAQKGGGQFFTADNAAQLEQVFQDVLDKINKTVTSFVAPAFTIAQANRLTLDNSIYLSMFEPSSKEVWPGNVKGYRITHDGIVDLDGRLAVDPATGNFVDEARSFWTGAADGGKVLQGGLSMHIGGYAQRHVYTYAGTRKPSNEDLTRNANRLAGGNPAITRAMLGLPNAVSDQEVQSLLNWARGQDVYDEDQDGVTGESRTGIMGAPLHSTPVVLKYRQSDGTYRKVLFTMNNNGFLHAFDVSRDDTSGGNELFAFIPQALLKHLKQLSKNTYGASGHPLYGLDGHLVAWRKDDSHAYLFFGMRRGGKNYYALDVSNPEKPRLMWRIEGGKGDFAKLAQTWSRPAVVRTKVRGRHQVALVFGGGYDTTQDGKQAGVKDAEGNAVYIVDAMTGKRLWWAGRGGDLDMPLDYSIPSDIRIVDMDGNGYADRLYFGDMGGELWRIDLHEDDITRPAPFHTLMGSVNDGTVNGNRHFYYPPAVGLMQHDGKRYLAVAIGSGYRAHPLDTDIQDRFYLFMDPDVQKGKTDLSNFTLPIKERDLYDATANDIGEKSGVDAHSALKNRHGWYIRLDQPGEKVLASPLIFDGRLFFNTYQPQPAAGTAVVDPCKPGKNYGRAYVVHLADATPALDVTEDGQYTRADRYIDLVEQTIPPEPKVVFTRAEGSQSSTTGGASGGGDAGIPQDNCTNYTDFWSGRKKIAGGCTTIHRTYWNEEK